MATDNLIPDMNPGGAGGASNGGRALDYRDLQSPAEMLSARLLPNSGATDRALALARTFGEFSSGAADIAGKLNSQAGAQAGAAAAENPNFQPKQGLAAITAYGSAYDAAAHVTYVNAQHTAMEGQLSDIEQKSAGDPVSFLNVATAARDATVKQTPAIYQPEVNAAWNQRIMAGKSRLQEQAIQTARSDAWESYTSTIDSRQRAALQTAAQLPEDQQAAVIQNTVAENRQQLDALVQARAITPEKSAVLQRHFVETFQHQMNGQHTATIVDAFMDKARAGDVDAADASLKAYISDPNVSDADKTVVTQHYLEESEKFQKIQSRVHANDLAAIGQQLVQGSDQIPGQGAYGPAIENRIHQLYKVGALNPEGLRSLLDTSMRNQVNAIGDDANNQMVDAAVHGTGPKLDPANKTAVAAADTYFRSHIAINGATPGSDLYAAGAAAFVKETNIVPPSVRSNVRVGLISGDPVAAAKAAMLADRLQQANPQASPFDDSEPKLAALSGLINSNLRAGMTPQQAYSMATQQTNVTPALKDLREDNYKAAISAGTPNNKALQDALNKATPGIFSSAPAAPVAMQSDYSGLVKQFYDQTGDLPKSQELAAQQLQRSWGVSRVNDNTPELTKYPIPDNMVATVRADIASSAKAAGYTGDPARIHLTPNAMTDQTRGQVWGLTHTDANGVEDIILDHQNRPLLYRVPAPDFAAQRQALIDSKLDAARKQRDAERAMAAESIQGEQALANYYLTPRRAPAALSVENR